MEDLLTERVRTMSLFKVRTARVKTLPDLLKWLQDNEFMLALLKRNHISRICIDIGWNPPINVLDSNDPVYRAIHDFCIQRRWSGITAGDWKFRPNEWFDYVEAANE